MKIILDTNFLLYCAKQKIDYIEEIDKLLSESYELVVPSVVIEELEKLKLKAKKLRDREAAELALQLIEFKKIKIIKIPGKTADEIIIKLAKEEKSIVCTLDREIRNKVKRVILINRYKKLMMTR